MNSDTSTIEKASLKRKQIIWVAVAAGAVLVYMNMGRLSFVIGPSSRKAPVALSTGRPHPIQEMPDTESVMLPMARQDALMGDPRGKWYGKNLVNGRGTCQLTLEVQSGDEDYIGYSNLLCVDYMPGSGRVGSAQMMKLLHEDLSPISTVLSGKFENGSFEYHVTKAIESESTKCALSTMTVTPFGSDEMKATWKDTCGGGEMGLKKLSR